MSRSKWKGPFSKEKKDKQKQILLKRNTEITAYFLNKIVWCHNGQNSVKIDITENMLGHKIGEFVFTRSDFSFKKKKKKN